jgi:uncharacterized membrane protein YhaH (DUF805 family)
MLVNHLLIYPIILILSLPLGYEVSAIIFVLFWMVALLPSVAVTVRRLQDTGNSGWVILFKPVSTMILVLVKGNSGPNKYGPDPYGDPEEPNIEDHFIA